MITPTFVSPKLLLEYEELKRKEGEKVIEFDYIITNGYVDISTLQAREKKGWNFVCTIPATQIHPHAMPTDKATIFSKYNKPTPMEFNTSNL